MAMTLLAQAAVIAVMPTAYAASPCPADWEPEICELKDVVDAVKKDSYDSVDVNKLLNAGIKRTIGTLTHGQFLDKEEYADMWKSFRDGGYAGIGVVVSLEDGWLRVMSVTENGPAEKAAVHPNDLITEVDGESLKGKTFKEATGKVVGKPGTDVTITIQRAGRKTPLHLTIPRAFVQTAQIKYGVVAPHIAWIRIPSFDEGVTAKTVAALKAIDQQDPQLKGLIVDFRNNGGGSLPAAVGVISIFLNGKQPAVLTQGHDAADKRVLYTQLDDYKTAKDLKDNVLNDPLDGLPAKFKTIPMAILIHQNSASAPELVSGTLQDYGRATILGKTSYGKGSVQAISERLNKTGLRLTTAHYFTGKGCEVNGYGITPDYFVDERASGDPADVLNFHEVDIPKADYEGDSKTDPLTDIRKERLKERVKLAIALNKQDKSLPDPILPKVYGTDKDDMLKQAKRYLQGLSVYQKQGVLSEKRPHDLSKCKAGG